MIETIKKLFPQSIINPQIEQLNHTAYQIFNLDDHLIAIPKSHLTNNEIELLHLLSTDIQISTKKTSHWQNFLEGTSQNMPIISGDLQIIYLDFRKTPDYFDDALWFSTLKEAIPNVIDWYPMTENRYHLLLKIKKKDIPVFEEIQAVIQTLDADFDTVTRAIIGFIHPLSTQLPNLYDNELAIVDFSFLKDTPFQFSTLSSLLLLQMGNFLPEHFSILDNLKQIIRSNMEYINLIQSLYENQGNLSQTAEHLYVHRNTLTYRLQKFYKETGMQLQNLSDLIICYICLP